jgi:hypothetical protein
MSGKRRAAPSAKRARGAPGEGGGGVAGEGDDCAPEGVIDVDTLPDELLLHVFVFLDTKSLMTAISGVCRRWRALHGDTPRVRVDLSFAPPSLLRSPPSRRPAPPLMGLTKALARFKHVETVQAPFGQDGIACAIAKCCPRLSVVDLTEHPFDGSVTPGLTDIGAVALAEHCPRLTSVDLSRGALTDVALKAFAKHCPRVTSLAVGGFRGGLTDACVHMFLERFGPQLTTVLIANGNFDNDLVVAVANHCPLLTTFGCPEPESPVTDAGVVALAQHCPLLKKVNISGCLQLTDVALVTLAERCKQLTCVDASMCNLLTDDSLVALGKFCPRLVNASFTSCTLTDFGVTALAKGCPRLTDVALSDCPRLTDAGVVELAKHCPRMKMLYLWECDELTDSSVDALVEHCKHLDMVNLQYCTQITKFLWPICIDDMSAAQKQALALGQ